MARFQKGQSGNPGGRPKTIGLVRNGASRLLPKALLKLEQLLDCGDSKVELAAAKEIIDRAIGRATESIEAESAKIEKLSVDTAVARAKLKLLEDGHDPDAQQITVVIPEYPVGNKD